MNKKLVSLVTMASIIFTFASPAFAKNFTSKQNVALNHAWTVTFNKPVNTNEAFENVYIKDSNGNKITTRIDFNDDHTKMIISPDDEYKPNSTYTLVVDGIVDDKGDKLSDNATMQFTTVNEAQQGSFDINKVYANGSTDNVSSNVEPNAVFDLELSKNIDSSTLSNVTVTDKDGNKANVKVTANKSEIDIAPNNAFYDDTKTITLPRNAFKCNTAYTINLNGVKSSDGQDIATKTYNFTTRDYKLDPTISGICDDDYFKFASQYDSDLFHPVDPATGYVKVGLWKAHDNNGQIIFDKDTYGIPYQASDDWNKYANLQARNQYDLAVQVRREYNKILAKNSSYNGKMVAMTNGLDKINEAMFELSSDWNKDMSNYLFNTRIYSSYSLGESSLDSVDLYSSGSDDMKNILRSSVHPQIYMSAQSFEGTDLSLQKLYLYQELCSLFGYDYAQDIENYMIQETESTNDIRDTMQKVQIGNITIWSEDGQFLFKY